MSSDIVGTSTSARPSPGIAFDGVSKCYSLREGGASLRGMLFGRRGPPDRYAALRDVTLSVAPGTTLGLIGGNGAGKSTLLRLAAGVSRPSAGHVVAPRETQAILQLGSTFDYTLTGLENARTALIVNGLPKSAAEQRLEKVVRFAELEGTIGRPVRTYSAGMVLRLAFGVAAQFEADAFLIDEVLTVGDLRFQEKCLAHLAGLRDRGATILLASHDLEQVAEICDRVAWLHAGRLRAIGPAAEVIDAYEGAMRAETVERTPPPEDAGGPLELRRNRFGSQELRLVDVRLNGGAWARMAPGEPLRVDLELDPVSGPRLTIVGLSIRRAEDGMMLLDHQIDLGVVDRRAPLSIEIARLDLASGAYLLDVGAYEADWNHAYDYHWGAYEILVDGPSAPGGVLDPPVRVRTQAVEGQARVPGAMDGSSG